MVQAVIPLLLGKLGSACQQRGWCQRQHLDTMDVLLLWPKPGCDVDFVLEENASDVVLCEVRMMVWVIGSHQEILAESKGRHRQHGCTQLRHSIVAQCSSPQHYAVM